MVLHNLIVRTKQKPKGLRDVKITKGKTQRSTLKQVKLIEGAQVCSACNGNGGWFVTRDANNEKGTHVWHPCDQCDERGLVED